MGGAGVGHLQSDLEHDLLKEGAVFPTFDSLSIGSDKAYVVLLQDSAMKKLHCGIQGGLSSKGRQQGVGLLPLDDLRDDLRGDRFDVGPVGKLRIGHDCRRIGVHQHHLVSLFCQGLAGLDPRVIELTSLTNDDRAGSDQENFMDGRVFGHGSESCALICEL